MTLNPPTTFKEARDLAEAYTKVRKKVRKLLLAELRLRLDEGMEGITDSERRKLHNFPSDLSDSRLLEMENRTRI